MPKVKKVDNPKTQKKEIVMEETQDDIVLGSAFSGDPDELRNEIKKEAERGNLTARFVIPLVTFLLVAGVSSALTWYYAKPDHAVKQQKAVEDKIETPPVINEEKSTEAATPAQTTPAPQVSTPPVAERSESTYTVKEGDTLSGIANQYDMTSSELATFNGLSDTNTLTIGQVLKIPTK